MTSRRSIAALFAAAAVAAGAAGVAVGALQPVREVQGQPEAAPGADRPLQPPAASSDASADMPAPSAEVPVAVADSDPAGQQSVSAPEAVSAAGGETPVVDTADNGSAAETVTAVDAAGAPESGEAPGTAADAEAADTIEGVGQEPAGAETDE